MPNISQHIAIDTDGGEDLYDEEGASVELETFALQQWVSPSVFISRCSEREKQQLRTLLETVELEGNATGALPTLPAVPLTPPAAPEPKKLSAEELIEAFNSLPDQELFGMPDEYLDTLRNRLQEGEAHA